MKYAIRMYTTFNADSDEAAQEQAEAYVERMAGWMDPSDPMPALEEVEPLSDIHDTEDAAVEGYETY